MPSPAPSSASSRLGFVRFTMAVIFGLLSVGFFLRMLQAAYRWMSGAQSIEVNYKVVTILLLIYAAITAGLAVLAWRKRATNGSARS